ncbi:aminopeptidase N [Rhodocyclaceae bacterium SMB388]
MTTETSHTVRRSDYAPLPWRVDRVDLHFRLDAKATVVTSRLQCSRDPEVVAGPLVLDGDSLELVSVRIDGAEPANGVVSVEGDVMRLALAGERAELEIVTRIDPSANTALSGLYRSQGGYFTQCEAEGFRRITWFADRPDVMARFTVTLEADRAECPVLLSNGNLVDQGELDGGRHFARWEDPFPKPSYLFALVAADLVALERRVETASGREVLLQVWVEEGNLDRTQHAMDSLVHAMRWDEETFGLELDLDRFMIVAVGDFNMGAMENKGLNIFNSKYVLARPDTATDADFEHIESVVAHEYFHNWTGNRVTCRDWFQLTLKEGLTVFRDQQFSADMLAAAAGASGAASARAVKRIDDVRVLRTAQFAEDAGPMAHPIRPESYQEINNFYTATVYEKGAEVIRMLHTLLGREGFRNGMDLYFSYHDGQAVTCDDFVQCMAEANGYELDPFMRWYSQAGTPVLRAAGKWLGGAGMYVLTLSQVLPATPGQSDKLPQVIPVALGLIGPDGQDLPLQLEGEEHAGATTRVLTLDDFERTYHFVGLPSEPVPSLLRGFSAPVVLELQESDERLAFRMAHDSDAFNRWDAGQRYAERVLMTLASDRIQGKPLVVPVPFIDALGSLLNDDGLDPAFRAQALAMPGETYLLERMRPADPAALRAALMVVLKTVGERLSEDWLACYRSMEVNGAYRYHPADAGRRALRNLALRYLVAAGVEEGLDKAETQFEYAGSMTECFGALAALVIGGAPRRGDALEVFHSRFRDDPLIMDKWFALQAMAWRWQPDDPPVLERVRELIEHEAFSRTNPNKVYALLGSFFKSNPAEFHAVDGSGYVFWADRVIELDGGNPQVASRMARTLENWRHFTPGLQTLIRAQIERVKAHRGLSPDVSEIVTKALAD